VEISCAMNGKHMDSKVNPKRKQNVGQPQLRWRDQYTIQEEGTDHVWPNA
jgi:hypothetical protein